jgi:hypothetical protein
MRRWTWSGLGAINGRQCGTGTDAPAPPEARSSTGTAARPHPRSASGLRRGPEAAMDCCLGRPQPPPCAPTPTSFGDECAGVPLAATRAAVALARLLRSPWHRLCTAQVAARPQQ